MLTGLSHIAIATPELERSIAFYTDLLGFEVVYRQTLEPMQVGDPPTALGPEAERTYVLLRNGDLLLTINKHHPVDGDAAVGLTGTGLNHIAFWVDDIEAETAKLEAAGVEFAIRTRRMPGRAYNVQGHVLTSIFKDPDGTHIQLDQHLPKRPE